MFFQLRSDKDRGDGTARYVLSGEGAGTIFRIDEKSGDLHATQRLDREEKASYTLQAQAFNKYTGLPLEPATEFIVKIHDINDNEPKFTQAVYSASVPEMSDVGEGAHIEFLLFSCFPATHLMPPWEIALRRDASVNLSSESI